MPNSPSILNYYQGSGNLYWTPDGGAERHVGNAIKFEVGIEITQVDHNERMTASRAVDRTFITATKANWSASLEEITPENLAMAFLGTVSTISDSNKVVSALATTSLRGQLRFVGTNDIGSKFEVTIATAQVTPSGSFDFLGEDLGVLELEGIGTGSPPFTIEELSEEATA
jgi:hypothetical protein